MSKGGCQHANSADFIDFIDHNYRHDSEDNQIPRDTESILSPHTGRKLPIRDQTASLLVLWV